MNIIPALLAALLAGATPPVSVAPRPSDEMPADMLAGCDARAAPYGRFDPAVAGAVAALVDLGVFEESEFFGLAIGFCGLAAAGGPVAATSCAAGTILLDEKYRRADEAFPLSATLAHEMKHHLQHTAQMARHGAGWCASEEYAAARAVMEEEADAFGDAVAALLYLGREIEIRNECVAPVKVWLEADRPRTAERLPHAFVEAGPGEAARAPFRAASGEVKYFAWTAAEQGEAVVWSGAPGGEKRRVAGETVRLRSERLKAGGRTSGPFTLALECD